MSWLRDWQRAGGFAVPPIYFSGFVALPARKALTTAVSSPGLRTTTTPAAAAAARAISGRFLGELHGALGGARLRRRLVAPRRNGLAGGDPRDNDRHEREDARAEAVAGRSAIKASVDARMERRPPQVVETAAYFVIAESLTNAAKHAGPDARAHVSIRDGSDRLTLEITDDGRGGADPAGSGLTGLRHRVEALDGALTVTSAAGHGTIIRAVLPY